MFLPIGGKIFVDAEHLVLVLSSRSNDRVRPEINIGFEGILGGWCEMGRWKRILAWH